MITVIKVINRLINGSTSYSVRLELLSSSSDKFDSCSLHAASDSVHIRPEKMSVEDLFAHGNMHIHRFSLWKLEFATVHEVDYIGHYMLRYVCYKA